MPNWVYNSMTITEVVAGELNRFKEHLKTAPEFRTDEDQRWFSFYHFIQPTGMTIEEHVGTPEVKDDNGNVIQEQTQGNWYNWRLEHWGTKWDACELSMEDNGSSMYLSFQTAWSPPSNVMYAMSTMFPGLQLEVDWEEEQGFGASYTMTGGNVSHSEEWDIPDSHADYVARGRECYCMTESDEEYWFDDCPGKTKTTYVIEVVTKYYVEARNDVDAMEAAKAEESGYDLPDGATIKTIEYAEEYRCGATIEEEEHEPANA